LEPVRQIVADRQPRNGPRDAQENVVKGPAPRRRNGHAILLVDDDPSLSDAIKDHLADEVMEVIQVHDAAAALGVLGASREIDLLMTAVSMPKRMSCAVAFMVRPLVRGVGFVFVTGRPQLLETPGEPRDKAFIRPADLAEATRHRLAA
jgi:hypothetical protein